MPFNVYGQDNAIRLLKSYLAEERLQGAFLFSGPEGVGKKLSAKLLAQAANCLGENAPCLECPSCKKIDALQHPDVPFIDSATPLEPSGETEDGSPGSIRIGHIRTLQKAISYKAYEARLKFFIIDNAHNLNPSAANALLKVLEEPPRLSVIILVTDKPFMLFKTIVSRCRTVKFAALNRELLENVLKQEHGFDPYSAHFLAFYSEGRLGRALSLKGTGIIEKKNALIDAFIGSKGLRMDNFTLQKREEIRDYLNILAGWFRDIYIVKTDASGPGLINSDRLEELKKSSSLLSLQKLNEITDAISEAILNLERNINTKLLLYNLGAVLWEA